jgi:hypothetical protein
MILNKTCRIIGVIQHILYNYISGIKGLRRYDGEKEAAEFGAGGGK